MNITDARAWFAGILDKAEDTERGMHQAAQIGYPISQLSPITIPLERIELLIKVGREYFRLIEAEDRRREAASRGGKASPPEVKRQAAKRGESKARKAKQLQAAEKRGISLQTYRTRPEVLRRRERYQQLKARQAEMEAEAAALRAAHEEGGEDV